MRRVLGIFLSVCLVWTVAGHWLVNCPCSALAGEPSALVVVAPESSCCAEADVPACCTTESTPIASDDLADENPSAGGCCSTAAGCLDCPHCLASDITVLVSPNIELDLSGQSVAVLLQTDGAVSGTDIQSIAYRPPDILRCSPHIATTVLLC